MKKGNKIKSFFKLLSFIYLFLSFLFVVPVFAETCTYVDPSGDASKNQPSGCTPAPAAITNTNNAPAAITNTNNAPAAINNNGLKINTGIKNPIQGIDNIQMFIAKILDFVLLVGIPILTLAIIYCGFLFVTAQGNGEKLKKAKQAFLYTLVGGVLLFGSFAISESIHNTVEEIRNQA